MIAQILLQFCVIMYIEMWILSILSNESCVYGHAFYKLVTGKLNELQRMLYYTTKLMKK
jgi:hypothetical protein